MIEYSLAPEHPFPAGLEDVIKAYTWLLEAGVRPGQVTLAGDSAGGGLVLSTMLALRERGIPLPAAGVCLSPVVDLSMSGESWKTNHQKEFVIDFTVSDPIHLLRRCMQILPGCRPSYFKWARMKFYFLIQPGSPIEPGQLG
jgi:acetyl esterase/lipase